MSITTRVVFLQLGSPKSPQKRDVRTYLHDFLSQKRVIGVNPLLWKVILNLFILPFRPRKSAKMYQQIWDGKEFPLTKITRQFSAKVKESIADESVGVEYAYILSGPTVQELVSKHVDTIEQEKWLVIPLFPQFSHTTTSLCQDYLEEAFLKSGKKPKLEFFPYFHDVEFFIEHSVKKIDDFLESQAEQIDALVISFHSLPIKQVSKTGDLYWEHCKETYENFTSRITNIDKGKIHIGYQSRFDSRNWISPFTNEVVTDLIKKGKKNIAIYCPSFVADCLETTYEIGVEMKEKASFEGGRIFHIPCLNDDQEYCRAFASFIKSKL
jgi:ferrochelatase